MTMLVVPSHSQRGRETRRARTVYRTLRTGSAHGAGSLHADLAMLALFLVVAAGVIALRAWLYVPQF